MQTCLNAFLVALVLTPLAASPAAAAGQRFDWNQWRYLPTQDGGRQKPLDTLSWETLRTISNRVSLNDPATGQRMDATTSYLAMLFEWRGWDQTHKPRGMGRVPGVSSYFKMHEPDKWDRTPLLRIDYLDLRIALGLSRDQKYVAPERIGLAKVSPPGVDGEHPFLAWADGLRRRQQEGLTEFEKKALEFAQRHWSYIDHRMGNRLAILPIAQGENQQWMSFAEFWRTEFDDASDPNGSFRQAQEQLRRARAAYFASSAEDFNSASASFLAAIQQLGPKLGPYPASYRIGAEVAYNHWAPFRFAWVLTTLAFLSLLLAMGTQWRVFHRFGWVAFAAAMLAMVIGFAMRVSITGRAPVTNMYESVIFVGAGVAALGMLFEVIYRRQFILAAAAAVAAVAWILADNCPLALDPSFRPLQPVLRNNFWLVTHVMTITLSYAAFALALGIGNITLGYYLCKSDNQETIRKLTEFTYRAIQVGVLLLAAGTILGGVWADYSWGRFWGWDPKEVWALITLLGYLAVLHARFAGWVRHFGLAALSVICFSLVVMAWYGVNFVLGAGLHSYGFGGGGQPLVFAAVGLQAIYVAAAALRYAVGESAPIRELNVRIDSPAQS